MLKIKEPSKDLFLKAKKGLLEIASHTSPFDICAAKKGAEYVARILKDILTI